MPTPNFTIQDVLGVSLACFVFPFVILFPGYVIGWIFNLFDFKHRHILAQHVVALLISIAVVPILFYLLASLFSFYVVNFFVICFFVLYLLVVVAEMRKPNGGWVYRTTSRYQRFAFFAAMGWVFLSVFSLVDFSWGDRLYNNVVSLDFATRATIVNAITRTGIPPVNPSYFPGRPEYITSLYYFWYILCSVIDQLGGDLIDSRMALIAGDVWCGLALMALIAFYIKIRSGVAGETAWKMALLGISLLMVSGLDIIPALTNMIASRYFYGFAWPPRGDIEHWNEQITAWVGSLFWVPHHIAALIACLTGFIFFQYYRKKPLNQSIIPIIIAGMAFASAVGLSTWVAITFSVFLGLWVIVLFVQNNDSLLIKFIFLAGIIALLSSSPFLIGVVSGGTGASGFPVSIDVRRFFPVTPFIASLPAASINMVNFVLLPVNYFMELGFFLVIGVIWLQQYRKSETPNNPFFIPEMVLLFVVFAVCSFIRSVIAANDLGWRGWLFGQFVILIWAVDLYDKFPFSFKIYDHQKIVSGSRKAKVVNLLTFLWLIGFSTTVIDVALLRFWPPLVDLNVAGFPNGLSFDTQLGKRTLYGRLAYEFINDKLATDIVIQQNPISKADRIDRPSGLYANRQFAISFNAPYNVPIPILNMRSKQISRIFALDHEVSWDAIDLLCKAYFIDVLVVNDQDSLWNNLPNLYQLRPALYKNRYFAVVPCGDFVPQNN